MPASTASRLGAACYVVWGLLHLQAAASVYVLGRGLEPGMVQGRVLQDAWNLLFFALAAIGIAAAMNWKGSRAGFWLNLAVVSVADVGFVLFVLAPGYVGWWPGLLGPLFWVLGWAFTALGLRRDGARMAGHGPLAA